MPSPIPKATLLSNAAKQKKILFEVKAQPWDQRPAAFFFVCFFNFIDISLCILYFSSIFHKQALR